MARVINTTLAVGFLGYVAFLYVNTVNHSYARLVRFANSDPLTRLFNRRHMVELIEYEQRKFERTKKNFSLIMPDVDDFKRVNDLFGHDAGDSVLIELSKRIKQELREHDSIARWGGEEFLVLLPETDIKNAEQIAERIKHVVTSNEFVYKDKTFYLTLSIGVSHYNEDESINRTINRADYAMYKGKKSGKNQVNIIN